ncbi:GNAT family N-acetyltransferase [Streptococcus oralis subsp. oralis]|uniref:GNAT family N-acetyltransferase n=1 Tax=Streptococcus oralis subsp. oralis TaxID=1891914 RepID=A0A1X1H6B3_STROR|nr:GNAT family N-acetyltransferase [Streptococcus oralis]ORO54630.1 GNAT family N-acetyltransferase [Streptococcus oralis subsp. oralis]
MHIRLENKESHKAQEIGDLIRAYNRSKREEAESEPLNLYLEDEKGNLMAGLVAETFGNWLEIEYLFVKEELRGQGIGSKLLQRAESEAKKRNCRFAFVNTYQFQAPDFYLSHGYKEVFILQDYPYTGKRYYYQKNL